MDMNRNEYADAFEDGVAIDEGAITENDVAPLDDQGASPAGEGAASEQVAAPQGVDMEREMQRLRSWEGRLRAREMQLREMEMRAAEAPSGPSPAESSEAAEAVEQVAEAVAAGQPMDEAMAALEADFGPEFVQALSALVEAKTSMIEANVSQRLQEQMGGVNQDVATLIEAIKNDRQREHFEFIADKHPDFIAIAESEPFVQWVSSHGHAAQEIIDAGTSRQVCALLDEFKRGQEKGSPERDGKGGKGVHGHDGAVAVPGRSGGLRLPTKPASSDDYLSAWDEA